MIRVVPTGDIGFDVVLGGGWCLVERLPGKESATILVRGGPGTGKTLLSVDIALALAAALGGDVMVGCVELLPSEYLAQIEAGRAALSVKSTLGSDDTVVALPRTSAVPRTEKCRVFCGLLGGVDEALPDLVVALEALQSEVCAMGGRPVVLVVDSLISGSQLGQNAPRPNVDALMKFAVQQGIGLVLCAETDAEPSAWDFAADTVLVLEQTTGGERLVGARKHRYGASVIGSHKFRIEGWQQPRIFPRLDSWLGVQRIRSALGRWGWSFVSTDGAVRLAWNGDMAPTSQVGNDYPSSFAVISGSDLELIGKLAQGLLPVDSPADSSDLVILLEPSGSLSGMGSLPRTVYFVAAASDPNSTLCDLVLLVGREMSRMAPDRPRRIVLGDLATLAGSPDPRLWAESVGTFAHLINASGWNVPVIAYDSSASIAAGTGPLATLRWRADLLVDVSVSPAGFPLGRVTSAAAGTVDILRWPIEVLARKH